MKKINIDDIRISYSHMHDYVKAGPAMNELGDVNPKYAKDITEDFNDCVITVFLNTKKIIYSGETQRFLVNVTEVGNGIEQKEIEDCPFCGGEYGKEVFTGPIGDGKYHIKCVPCGVQMIDDRKDKVRHNWNERSSLIRLRKVLEELKNENPYPEKTFPEPAPETMMDLRVVLNEAAFNQEQIFGAFGRKVWDECIRQFAKYLNA